MKSYVFKVAIEPDKFEDGRDAWHAFCPALKGCHTWGHTHEEALANLRDAIDLYVQDLIEAGVHFGHRASRWNPKMRPYIYGKRNLIHIIDLRETVRNWHGGKLYVREWGKFSGDVGAVIVIFDEDRDDVLFADGADDATHGCAPGMGSRCGIVGR